jgi:hypothetical protein
MIQTNGPPVDPGRLTASTETRLFECFEREGVRFRGEHKRRCLDQRRGSRCRAVRTARIRRFVLEINRWRSGRPQAHFLQAPLASASDTIAATTARLG